ncbi:helix-turn-helix domain-containing protein [uncultured Bartonella sp.]|uniref:helix-turn-helix domain-containing protein n=1 Tax=uncultured Bartonella sp. TaxID=104108 RepID=UPI0026051120|nr:helix-turn-helix domain-containing protein [uncultured Bartonella sp.]
MSCYSHLSFEEREEIYQLRASGHSQDFIARHPGRNRSTISHELSRNRLCSGGYSALLSHGRYLQGRQHQAGLEKNEAAKTLWC